MHNIVYIVHLTVDFSSLSHLKVAHGYGHCIEGHVVMYKLAYFLCMLILPKKLTFCY